MRIPCSQLNEMHPDLLNAVTPEVDGWVRRKARMMARILRGGWVRPGDSVIVKSEPEPIVK